MSGGSAEGGTETRCPTILLDDTPAERDAFGPHHISFLCDMPDDGRYQVGLKALYGPEQGIVQMFHHDNPVGKPMNLYAEERRASDVLPLGVLPMIEGDNPVFLVLVGKDERSETFGLDAVELVCERVE